MFGLRKIVMNLAVSLILCSELCAVQILSPESQLNSDEKAVSRVDLASILPCTQLNLMGLNSAHVFIRQDSTFDNVEQDKDLELHGLLDRDELELRVCFDVSSSKFAYYSRQRKKTTSFPSAKGGNNLHYFAFSYAGTGTPVFKWTGGETSYLLSLTLVRLCEMT